MKNKYMIKLAFINILKKKKRTQLSLIATILSTAIIFSACILFKNVNDFKNLTSSEISNYHYAIYKNEDITLSSRYHVSKESDLEITTAYNGNNHRIKSLEVEEDVLPFILKEGKIPQNASEILVEANMPFTYGQEIALKLSNGETKIYNVVGIYESNSLFVEIHKGESIIYTYTTTSGVDIYYVKDEQAHVSSSFDSLIKLFDVTTESIYTHADLITIDTIKTYLQDTTLIQIFYLVIIALCIGMSLISIHNVLIISDQSRKREIGLLKSIGAGPKAIKKLLFTELFVLSFTGASLGILLGLGVSYLILIQFIDTLYLTFSVTMLVSLKWMVFSFILGFGLMYVSGLKAYYKYVYSTAISDLKENNYHFIPPMTQKTILASGFGWKMFGIYNRRMKKQTRNIRTSFVLLIVTSVLFMSVVFSSLTFRNKNIDKPYDLEIKSINTGTSEVSYRLYEMIESEDLKVKILQISRLLNSSFRTNPESYNNWYGALDYYKQYTDLPYTESVDKVGDVWCNVYHYATALDRVELERLKPYVVSGSLDNLREKDVVAIYREAYDGAELCKYFEVGDIVAYYPLLDLDPKNPISTRAMKREHGRVIAAIVHMDDQEAQALGYPFSENKRIMAYSYDVVGGDDLQEIMTINLQNRATSIDVQESIEAILSEIGCLERYTIHNIALEIETNKITSFIMQVLLYPLFFMLFIVSLMNIHNVLSGNIVLKHNDIAIMRSVGMSKKQLRLILLYEYLEGYMNASVMTVVFFIPIILLESKLELLSSFDFADNLFGTLIFSICFMGAIMLIPLIIVNIRKFQKIKALDALKDSI